MEATNIMDTAVNAVASKRQPQIVSQLEALKNQTERLLTKTDQLKGRLEPVLRPFNSPEVIEGAEKELENLAEIPSIMKERRAEIETALNIIDEILGRLEI